jgi:formylmethanofuran dehydrogenase subunit C
MKRGSIVLFGSPGRDPTLLPTFRYACDFSPGFLPLYLKRLGDWGFPLTLDYVREGIFRRYCGDGIALGKGEILAWRRA